MQHAPAQVRHPHPNNSPPQQLLTVPTQQEPSQNLEMSELLTIRLVFCALRIADQGRQAYGSICSPPAQAPLPAHTLRPLPPALPRLPNIPTKTLAPKALTT